MYFSHCVPASMQWPYQTKWENLDSILLQWLQLREAIQREKKFLLSLSNYQWNELSFWTKNKKQKLKPLTTLTKILDVTKFPHCEIHESWIHMSKKLTYISGHDCPSRRSSRRGVSARSWRLHPRIRSMLAWKAICYRWMTSALT